MGRWNREGLWRKLHALTPGCPLVEFHGVARRVDNHHTQAAGRADYLIHPRRHGRHALRRQAAGVSIPHVADDYGCLCHVPAQRAFDDLTITSPTGSEVQRSRYFGAIQDRLFRL